MKNCYRLLNVFPLALLIILINSYKADAQGSYYFKEDFDKVNADIPHHIPPSTDNGGLTVYFKTQPLEYIKSLLFYDGSSALPGQNRNWGPVYTTDNGQRKGAYSIVTNSKGFRQEFFYEGPDHTDDDNGYMLLVDAHNNTTLYFDREFIQPTWLLPGRRYKFSLWVKNVNNEVTETNKPAPAVSINIYDNEEYDEALPTKGRLAFATGAPPRNTPSSGLPQWHKIELKFELPIEVNSIRLQIRNNVANEYGNDLAIDDIEFYTLDVEAFDDEYGPYDSSVGGVTPTVLENDKLDDELIDPTASPLPVKLTPGQSPQPGLIEMDENGVITVRPGTPPGEYKYPYTICSTEADYEDICDDAVATVVVECDDTVYFGGAVTVKGTGEKLEGVIVKLFPVDETGVVGGQLTNTDANGLFEFKDIIPPGTYRVVIEDTWLRDSRGLLLDDPREEIIITVDICEPVVENFVYDPDLNIPFIGDFVWLDINNNNVQDEWYDANGDGKITKNVVGPGGSIAWEDWEWFDANENDTWDQPEDVGELNKAGLRGDPINGNITVTGPGGYTKTVVVGIDGIWRDEPTVGPWEEGIGLFGDFTATLTVDEFLESVIMELYATGKVKNYDEFGNEVPPPAPGGRIAFNNSSARTSRKADDPLLEVKSPFGLEKDGHVDEDNRIDDDLDFALNAGPVVLPVSWIDFAANWDKEAGATDLRWSTASEFNNKGFEVEHSTNGAQWNKVGFVAAEEAKLDVAARLYRFSHSRAANGINYYRLKQLDQGGGFDYSVIRSVTVSGAVEHSVFPNPASDLIHLSESVQSKGVKSVHLLDPAGRTIRKYEGDQSKLNLTGVGFGLYHLKIYFHDGTTETTKVLKR